MAAAQASNGVAAAWPTTGKIFSVAEVSRQGSAATAQPLSGSSAAPVADHIATHAATRRARLRKRDFGTTVSDAPGRQAVVLT
jgi:hypothetical protein